ncbi:MULTISPECIES: replicative DNA helicase [Acinetobacter]|uniref:replicative DNA helicase n=1 Tax=Acinetobacter TaxID=469 RepID=UPI0001B8E668|nr:MULTISPECIES: replicative DNA helicase [Acinetobacter]EEX01577.1 replicative DNA helicase [Acinetobacter sp. RUH 2624]MBR7739526.1 replicative DNA helicase [Acinetobacter nosocomialis]MBZ6534625.1 replicative DNA helicase [Acinetobacter seifertii]QNY07065.1 replicative DNA helicase [Acinetobacter seifertii]QNY17898.1 replicative DNA helicase [Acinetobacter seifertii]
MNTNTPPIHNLQIEQAVLAALMTVAGSYAQVENLLSKNDFYATRHKLIFSAIVDLDEKNSPYDAVLVNQWLEVRNYGEASGGEKYLIQLMNDAPSSFYNLQSYAEKLKDLTVCRQVEAEAIKVIQQARHLTVNRGELVQNAQTAFANLNTESGSESLFHIHDAASNTFVEISKKMEAAIVGTTLIKGIQTGIYDLDKKLGDVEPGCLMIVAARPAMGKTTMMQIIANHVSVVQKKPVLIMSGEMPKEQIAMRLCCAIAPADISLVRNSPHLLPKEEFTAYTNAVVQLKNVPMQINDTSRPSIANIRESIRKVLHQYGSVGLVLIDYLQIMKTSKQFAREDLKIAYFTGELKAMAKEFNCVIVLLSQLNRELEKRPNKRPMMSDLRESGAIEQDADQIVFLYRDEVYNRESQFRGIAEAIVSKNRHGEVGTAYMHSQLKYCQFTNLDHDALNQIQGIQ